MSPRTLPLLATLLLLTAPRPTAAQSPTPASDTSSAASAKIINMDVSNADLATVISLLQREAGVRIEVQGGLSDKFLTLTLTDVSLPAALQAIAQHTGAVVEHGSHGGYLLRPGGVKALPFDTPAQPATQVLLNVEWVTVSTEQINREAKDFARVPFTPPTAPGEAPALPLSAFMETAARDSAARLYGALTQTRGRVREVQRVSLAPGQLSNLGFEVQVTIGGTDAFGEALLTSAVCINPNNSISLDVQEQVTAADAPPGQRTSETAARNAFPHLLRTVPSGGLMVLRGPLTGRGLQPSRETLTFIHAYLMDRSGRAINAEGSVVTLSDERPAVTVTQ